MDQRKSSLNPYASSYIPLSLRGKGSESKPQINHEDSAVDIKNASPKHPEIYKRWQLQNPDEETEMDLAYLGSIFRGVSEQSLADVYYANGCDVETSIDMLRQLEYPGDFSQRLPDTLDIGDVAEFESVPEGTTGRPRVMTGEASGSSYTASKYVL